MADRRIPIALGVALFVALLLIRGIPYLTQQREVIASTPTPHALNAVSPVPVKPGSTACMTQVTFSPQAQAVQFDAAGAAQQKTPPLVVTAKGPGYRASARVNGGRPGNGSIDVAIRPASHSLIGELCIRNAGRSQVALAGTTEGRTVGRSLTTVDGVLQVPQVSLTLHERAAASLGSRIGALFRHATALNPMTPLLAWILAIVVLLLVPLAAFWALAASFRAEAGGSLVADAAPLAVPLERHGRRLRARAAPAFARVGAVPAWAWLVAGLVLAVALLTRYGINTHSFQNDEARYVYLARWTDTALPHSLWDFTFIDTGLQRLSIWVLAPIVGFFGGPDWARIGHTVYSLLWVSTAVPVFLTVRALRLSARWAALAAFLTIVVPWAVLATSFLTESVAYPAWAFAVWVIWRTAVRPSWRSDVLAIALIFVAGLARVNLLSLAGVLAVTVIVQELRFGQRGPFARRLSGFARTHAVLVAAAVLVGLVVLLSATGVVSGTNKIAGFYGFAHRFNVPTQLLTSKLDVYTTRFIAGFAFIPFVFGLAWTARTLFRPLDPQRFAFALVGLLAVAAIIYTSAGAGFDERYIIYYAPLFAVAFVAAIARRETPPLLVAAAGIGAAVLLHDQGWSTSPQGSYSWFVAPAETFYANTVLGRLSNDLQASGVYAAAFVLALIVVAVCTFAATRHRAARATIGVLVGAVVLAQLYQTQTALSNFVNGAGSKAAASDSQRSWVDQALWGKSHAAVLAVGQGNTLTFDPIWSELQFWNGSVTQVATIGDLGIRVPLSDPYGQTTYDSATGRLTPGAWQAPYYVVLRSFVGLAFDETVVKQAPYLPLDLIKLRSLQLRWIANGAQPDGYLNPGQPVSLRVYRAVSGGQPACAAALLTAPAGLTSRVALAGPGGRQSALVKPLQVGRVSVPLRWRAGQRYLDLTLSATGKLKLADGRVQSMQIAGIATGPCA